MFVSGMAVGLLAPGARANESWSLVHSEVNRGNAVMSLSAIDGNTAWAVGISKQGSSQTPAGWRTINGTDWGYMSLPSGTGGAMQYTIVIANAHGIFGVYSYREVFEFERFWAVGSGRRFALGAMFAVYDRAKTAREIASAGVAAGCEFDTSSAGPIRLQSVKLKS